MTSYNEQVLFEFNIFLRSLNTYICEIGPFRFHIDTNRIMITLQDRTLIYDLTNDYTQILCHNLIKDFQDNIDLYITSTPDELTNLINKKLNISNDPLLDDPAMILIKNLLTIFLKLFETPILNECKDYYKQKLIELRTIFTNSFGLPEHVKYIPENACINWSVSDEWRNSKCIEYSKFFIRLFVNFLFRITY